MPLSTLHTKACMGVCICAYVHEIVFRMRAGYRGAHVLGVADDVHGRSRWHARGVQSSGKYVIYICMHTYVWMYGLVYGCMYGCMCVCTYA